MWCYNASVTNTLANAIAPHELITTGWLNYIMSKEILVEHEGLAIIKTH